MQIQSDSGYSGSFLSYPDIWHAWGNSQTIALAELTQTSSDSTLLIGANREVDQFYPQLLLKDGLNEYQLSNGAHQQFPQIAYGSRCLAVGALTCSLVSCDSSAARLAGLLASWLLGNNAAGLPMYDPATGRGYDGLLSDSSINQNAGAESTIEALQTLLEIEQSPLAVRFLSAKPVSKSVPITLAKGGEGKYRIYKLKNGERWVLVYSNSLRNFKLLPEQLWQK